jgi:CheY-like chemotaxis protein
VTYLSDHEPFFEGIWRPGADSRQLDSILHEGDRRHAKFMAGADLVIHDAQYTAEEYKSKKNWGHSPFEYVVEMAAAAGVRRLALTHHDPSHNDDFIAEIECRAQALAHARDPRLEVFCAFEGYELELTPAGEHHPFSNAMTEPHAPRRRPFSRILVINGDDDAGRSIKTALGAEGFILIQVDSARAAFESIAETTPDLVLADLADPADDKAEFVQAFQPGGAAANIPLLVLSGEDPSLLSAAGIDPASIDYLPRPFTIPQLRARVRARLERGSSK